MPTDKFNWEQTGGANVGQCVYCRHNQGEAKCTAFPAGIPDAILLNVHDHTQPYPGDHGVTFEPLSAYGDTAE